MIRPSHCVTKRISLVCCVITGLAPVIHPPRGATPQLRRMGFPESLVTVRRGTLPTK